MDKKRETEEDWLTKLEHMVLQTDPLKDQLVQNFIALHIRPLLEAEFAKRKAAGLPQRHGNHAYPDKIPTKRSRSDSRIQ